MTYILHLSDLHIVEQSPWYNMKALLLETVRDKFANLPSEEKLIIITGDFHNYNDKNYNVTQKFIEELVKEANVDIEHDVFVVPGNHDHSLLRNRVTNKANENTIKSVFDNISEIENDETIKLLIKPFDKYNEFVRNTGIYNELNTNPSDIHVRTWRDKLNIIHTNTALIADGKHKTDQVLNIKGLVCDDIKERLSNGLPTIVLGHNSFYDLHPYIQRSAEAFFAANNVAAYLAGDQHRFNTIRNEQFIYLSSSFSNNTIPNIVCGKGVADIKDTYSDFGFIIHHWEEESGKVHLHRYSYNPNNDQYKFEIESIQNVYTLTTRNSTKVLKFMFSSNVNDDDKKRLTQKIQELGGRVLASKKYLPEADYLIYEAGVLFSPNDIMYIANDKDYPAEWLEIEELDQFLHQLALKKRQDR